MTYFHVTDEGLIESVLRDGLIGSPVVYLTTSRFDALAIRRSQERLGERSGPVQVLAVEWSGEVFVDPHVKTTPFGPVAFLAYADVPSSALSLVY